MSTTTERNFANAIGIASSKTNLIGSKSIKKYVRPLLMLGICMVVSSWLLAQSAGDYRSNATTMNWNSSSSWQKYNGSSWIASTDYPGQNACSSCTVTIQNGNTVTLNVSPANSVGNIIVGGGTNGTLTLGTYTLTISGDLTVRAGATLNLSTGTLTVSGITNTAGTISDASNTGVVTFTGLVTKTAGTWTSTSVTTASNLIFHGGFINSAGTFTAGAATIGDNQTLTGIVNMSFANGVNILGNKDITIAGTTGTGVSFGGTSINYTVRNLNLTGRLAVTTTGNLTVTGTTNITGAGAFIDNNNSGITTFSGLITHNSIGSWTSTSVTTATNMVFNGGVNNIAGNFSAGAATIANNQTLTGEIIMTFANGLVISGAGNTTFAGAGGIRLGGTAINYTIPGNLTLTGKLLVSTTGNFTVSGTTSITGAGDFTDNNNTGVSSFTGHVTHNSTGRWTSTSVITAANMIFTAGFTNTAGTFSAGAATIGDNQTLTGTVNMSFSRGINILGNGDITIAGTSTSGVTMGGTSINYIVRNLTISGLLTVSTSGNLSVTGTTTISGTGKFTDNNATGTTSFTGLVTVGSAASFVATTVTTIGRLNFAGGIVQNNTTPLSFVAGTIRTTATQTWSGAGSIKSNGVIDVNTGTLTNNLTGGIIVGSTLTGTTLVQGTNAKLTLNSTTPASITTLTATASGNLVEFASAGNATLRGQTYYHLTITGSGSKVVPTSDITVNGNLTIAAGAISNTTNNRTITVAGNWINNIGASGFAAGTGTVILNGSTAQSINGTGTTSFKNLTINNSNGVTQTTNSTVTGVLTLTAGKFITGSTTLIISSTGSVVRSSGYIFGNEQMNVSTGSNVTRTFDIGDANVYTPVVLNFASVSVAGNITANTTNADHTAIIHSTLNGGVSINRFWTLTNSGCTFTNYTATFNYVSGDKDGAVNTSNILVGKYTASTWTYPTIGTRTSTSAAASGITSFGDFVLAEAASCSTPSLIITNPSSVCKPTSVNITNPAITVGSTPGLTFTYWNDSMVTSSLSNPTAITMPGTYYIKGTITGGCYNVQPVVVTTINPTGAISGNNTICTGTSTTLSIDVTGTGPWNGTLSDGTAFSGSSSPLIVTVSPTTNTIYSISTLSDANCTAQSEDKTGSASITVMGLPTTANAGVDQSNCGTNFTLSANTPTVGIGSWSIVSGDGGTIVDPTSPTSAFIATTGVTYVLRWSITNSPCNTSTNDVTISSTGGLWIGSVDSDWNNAANWCGGEVPASNIDLILGAGLTHYPLISGNITIEDIAITSGAEIVIDTEGILTITGSYSNNGTLTNNGTIVLNGSDTQNFPGASATIHSMYNLEVDNTAGVTIDQSFGIKGILTSTNGTIDLTDKNITLLSDSLGTASVAPVGGEFAYSSGGKFIVQKYIPARRAWRLLTAPVTNSNTIFNAWQNGGVYTPGVGTMITTPAGGNGTDAGSSASMKTFNYNTQALINVTNTNTPISGNTGSADNITYFTFVRGDRNPANISLNNSNVTTLSSAGELQTGDQTFSAATLTGRYTMIGNPYASPVDFDKLTRTNLMKRFYVWDPTLNQVGGYVMLDDIDGNGEYSKSVLGSSQTKIIESGQGILVQTSSDGPASILFTEEAKEIVELGGRPSGSGSSPTLKTQLFLLENNGTTKLADGTIAEYNDIFSREYNFEDAPKMTNTNENIGFFRGNKTLAAERMPIPIQGDTMFYKLTKTTARAYRLSINAADVNQKASYAILEDLFLNTNTVVNLNGITTVDFNVTSNPASASADRFRLVFKHETVLPIKFASVIATKKLNANLVQWSIANETNVHQYEIEKSTDGVNYFTAHIMPALYNNGVANYNWTDENITSDVIYYRIKSVEKTGISNFSQVVIVNTEKKSESIKGFIAPSANSLQLQFTGQKKGNYKINLLNDGGQLIYSNSILISDSFVSQNLDLKKTISKGIYLLEIIKPDNSKNILKLYK